MSPAIKSTTILGCRLDLVDWPTIETICQEFLQQKEPKTIVTLNGEFVLTAQKDADFQKIINRADLVIPDTTNLTWAARYQGVSRLEPTPGVELVDHLCKILQNTGQTLFLLGSRGEVPKKAAARLEERYPGLKIAGYSTNDPENAQSAQEIKMSAAQVVLVAYGAPKQEKWINQHRDQTGAKILVGVGGSFDMIAGVLPRAPKLMRILHLEWLWRLILQPSRFGRIWNSVVIFPLKVIFGSNLSQPSKT